MTILSGVKLIIINLTIVAAGAVVNKILFLFDFVKYVGTSQLNSHDIFIYGKMVLCRLKLISKFKNKKNILILDGMISNYKFSFKNLLKNSDNFYVKS